MLIMGCPFESSRCKIPPPLQTVGSETATPKEDGKRHDEKEWPNMNGAIDDSHTMLNMQNFSTQNIKRQQRAMLYSLDVMRNVTSILRPGDTPIHPDNIGGWVMYPPAYVFWALNGSGPIVNR